MSRVLVIGDLHAPAVHPDYFDFVKSIKRKHRTDKTVFIGDVIDHHVISFHKANPESPDALREYNLAFETVKKWYHRYPNAVVTVGNHDSRVHRLASDAGIPSLYLKEYNELYNTKNWEWEQSVEIDNVYYYHGTGASSAYPAFNAARARNQSVVMGHHHTKAAINWLSGSNDHRIFGMSVGCGVNNKHLSMLYSEHYLIKPMLSCGVVIDGYPILEVMPV